MVKVPCKTKIHKYKIWENMHESSVNIHVFIANVQNIFNLIGWEEYDIGLIVLSTSILYSLTKK